MKKGLRLVTLLVAFVLLIECSPIEALADDSHILTSEELTAAWALAGLDENAAPYHEGMEFSASMNASQMRQWLDELLRNDIAAVKHLHSEMENTLGDMKREDPEQYRLLTQGANDESYQAMLQTYRDAEELRQILRFYRDRLEQKASMIRQMTAWLTTEGHTRSQQLSASREIEEAVALIREIRTEMTENSGKWLQSIEGWNNSFRGTVSNGANAVPMDNWIADVRAWKEPKPLKTSVSASVMYPGGSKQSVMGRLNLMSSALADSSETVDITVMNKDDIGFEIFRTEDEQPLANATLTVSTADGSVTQTAVTNEKGVLVLKANDFSPDDDSSMDLTVEVSAENTQDYIGKGLTVQKGESMRIYQNQASSQVSLISVSFRGSKLLRDVLKTNYDALFSPNNDDQFEFEVITSGPASVKLKYTDVNGKDQTDTKATAADSGKNIATFNGAWKSVIKPGSKVKVAIEGGAETELKLNLIRGVVDVPSQDFMGVFDTAMAGGISFKFPGNIPVLSNISLNFTIPWQDFLHEKLPIFPRMLLNLDGSYGLFSGGVPDLDDKFNKLVSGWKNSDAKELNTQMVGVEKTAQNIMDKVQSLMNPDSIPHIKRPLIGQCEAHLGMFVCFIARYKTDQGWRADVDDFQLSLRFQVGVILTFGAQLRWYVYPAPLISMFIGFDASLVVGLTLDVAIERQNKHTTWTFAQGSTGLTITIRFQITLGLSVDLALVSITLGGYAYIRIVFNWIWFGPNSGAWFEGYAGMGVFLEVRVLFFKFKASYNFADIPGLHMVNGEWKLFNTKGGSSASNRESLPWFAPLLSVARAEENTDPEEVGESRHVEEYGALIPEAQPVLQNLSIEGSRIRYVDINGLPYVFYISAAQGDGKSRLTWVNIQTGASGFFQDFLTGQDGYYPNLYDYAFDVQAVTLAQEWIDTAELSIPGNRAFYEGKDMVAVSLLCTTGFHNESMEKDGQIYERQVPNDTRSYVFAGVHDPASDSFQFVLPGEFWYLDGSELRTADQWTIYQADALDWTAKNVQLSMIVMDDQYSNIKGMVYMSALLDDAETGESNAEHLLKYDLYARYMSMTSYGQTFNYAQLDQKMTDLLGTSSDGQVRQVRMADTKPLRAGEGFGSYTTYYWLTDKGAPAGQWRLMRNDGLLYAELDVGDIAYYDVLWNRSDVSRTDVFYLKRDVQAQAEGDDAPAAETYHLMALEETFGFNPNKTSQQNLTVERSDLDVTVPTDSFSLQRVDNTVYVYWMEMAGGQTVSEQTAYRLRGLIFDPETRISTDDFVMAQFATAHKEDAPIDMFLSANGMAYYTVKQNAEQDGDTNQATVYAYQHGLKAHADLRAFASAENLVMAGSDTDMYITVTNDGSANINTIKFEIVLEDDAGHVIQGPDGQDQIIETLYMDLLNPANSSRTVTGDAASYTTGEHAIYRVEELPGQDIQDRFNIEAVETYWDDYAMRNFRYTVSDPVVTALESKALLPGQTAGFVAAVHIPADWENLKHVTIRLAQDQNNGLRAAIEGGYGKDKEQADHSVHDLNVIHRVYAGPRGEDYLHLTISNRAENGDKLKLYAEVYLDDDHTPIYVDLPYYPEYTSTGMVHNLDMPLASLLNGRTANVANVTIRAVGVDDRLATNNDFTIYLPEGYQDTLRISLQPADQTVLIGDTAVFYVIAAGGREPYEYQWQEYMGSNLGWRDIAGATADTLEVADVQLPMTGKQYRCVITDHGLDKLTSDSATLNVVSVLPPTGDHTNLPLYLSLAAAALLLAAAVRYVRRKRKATAE